MLTLNEEDRIEEALMQFKNHVDYILVWDGGSTDRTVKIAEKIADKVVINKVDDTDFAKEKNMAREAVPKDCVWLLWFDVDERWDKGFVGAIKYWIEQLDHLDERGTPQSSGCVRFPRINMPKPSESWPDYQVRIFPNSRDILWKGKTHEVPYYMPTNMPLDQMNKDEMIEKGLKIFPVWTAKNYPIIHLPRQKVNRSWW